MNKKKDFSAINPALAFINTQPDVQLDTHDNAQLSAPDDEHTDTRIDAYTTASETEQYQAPQHTQQHAYRGASTAPNYIRTQGRKGKRKPRINLAFDSVEFLDKIRTRAEYEDKSITQLVNEACALYLKRKARP